MRNRIADHAGELVVVKFGGNAMVDPELSQSFCEDILTLSHAGARVVVTHGGGPQISAELAARGISSEFRGGHRVTTVEAAEVVHQILESIGNELVSSLRALGSAATLLSGESGGVLTARRAEILIDGELVDLGRVGLVPAAQCSAIHAALDAGHIPVVCAMGRDIDDGELLNINADIAAASIASALSADWLLLLTDVAGVYRDWPDPGSLVSTLSVDEIDELLPTIGSGMIPKLTAAKNAIIGGVGSVAIVDGREPHILAREAFGSRGTTIRPAEGHGE